METAMSSHRVVYFTDSEAMGGAEQALLMLISTLDTRRWTPTLFHHGGRGIAPLIGQLRELGVPDVVVPRMPRLRSVGGLAYLVRTLRASQPSVFHANLNRPDSCRSALLAATIARVPTIVATQHFFGEAQPPARRRHRLAVRGVDRFIAVSHDTGERLRTWLSGSARVTVVHNGISLDRFSSDASDVHSHARTTPSRGVVLAVGRLVQRKGYHHLLDAAVRLPGVRILLAGEGPERFALEERARALGVSGRVEFLGHREDVPELLSSCDVFVLPSLFEGHPLSVLEAMAAGRPVVATDSGGTREAVVHGETGLLVPAGDPAALAEAILSMLTDPARARRMGAAGRVRVHEEFSAQGMVHRVTRLYDELLEKSA
jgi:glycosyltransferase involved in cell wall biosynthesis